MSFDTIMAIVAVAIAVGQVVAASKVERLKTVLIGFAALAVLVTLAVVFNNVIEARHHEEKLTRVENTLLNHLTGPATFEDIYQQSTNYESYDLVNEAIDAMIDDGRLDFKKATVTTDGQPHDVRLFFKKAVGG